MFPETSSQPCLYQNYPNPFYYSTKISYSFNEPGFVTLNIYDLQGRKIKSLVNEFQKAGTFSVIVGGSELTTGIYFYKMEVGNEYMDVKKLILLR
ncbi:MAG: hypothetical protein B6D61_05220 [Bacteroidetes bacterium 4484_249]|nr:MAG: hypothetical protein B6D61_05220 [Bacteroidetes bacterium 4484_249]